MLILSSSEFDPEPTFEVDALNALSMAVTQEGRGPKCEQLGPSQSIVARKPEAGRKRGQRATALASPLSKRRRIDLPRFENICIAGLVIALDLLRDSAQVIGVREIGIEPDCLVQVGDGAIKIFP